MPRRAFTLIEVLLAVGAAAIIAVGIAAVFAASGDVIRGGRRVSHFSRYAAQIEAQLRADFASMTRDGYLLIRNEEAYDGDDIATFPDQLPGLQRPRRIDEIMFFARGDYRTAREALMPGYIARTDAARIYYGHGMPINPLISSQAYEEPEVLDVFGNDTGFGIDADSVFGDTDIAGNPLAYAADWVLMRHVLLLKEPGDTITDLPPSAPPYGIADAELVDTDRQIGLQPASSHLFRVLMNIIPDSPTVTEIRGNFWPQIASGLVDIATTNLHEIRSIVIGMQDAAQMPIFPGDVTNEAEFEAARLEWSPRPLDLSTDDGRLRLGSMHSWMLEGLPAFSHITGWDNRVRMRCEPIAPNYVGMIGDETLSPREQVYRPADQLMLSASNFAPNCTEFIVEWSFGEVFPNNHNQAGQLVWHGLERFVDIDGDGNPMNDDPVAIPYDTRRFDFTQFAHSTPYRLNGAQQSFGSYPVGGHAGGGGGIGGGAGASNRSWLIHGLNYIDDMEDDRQLMSFFGYHDPTFEPNDPNRNGNNADAALAESTPWPWPKLLRVTLTLADPSDPSIEETFQFVIDLPGTPAP